MDILLKDLSALLKVDAKNMDYIELIQVIAEVWNEMG